MGAYQLAQVNIALPLEPLESARLADFVAGLDRVNAAADGAPGFVWRLQTEDGNATAVRILDNDGLIINMSVWASLDALADYAYRNNDHRAVLRRRREWFVQMREAYAALWWVPAGHRPTPAEAEERLLHLRAHGPTAHAFTFRTPFPAPDADTPITVEEDWRCPAG